MLIIKKFFFKGFNLSVHSKVTKQINKFCGSLLINNNFPSGHSVFTGGKTTFFTFPTMATQVFITSNNNSFVMYSGVFCDLPVGFYTCASWSWWGVLDEAFPSDSGPVTGGFWGCHSQVVATGNLQWRHTHASVPQKLPPESHKQLGNTVSLS